MSLGRLYGVGEAAEQWPRHSSMCVCKGKGYIERVTHGQLPTLPGQNMGAPSQGLKKVACPYGDLSINRPAEPAPFDPDDGWDF